MSPESFRTRLGWLLFHAVAPVDAASRAMGGPSIEPMLLARHRLIDHLLRAASERGEIGYVIEVACGGHIDLLPGAGTTLVRVLEARQTRQNRSQNYSEPPSAALLRTFWNENQPAGFSWQRLIRKARVGPRTAASSAYVRIRGGTRNAADEAQKEVLGPVLGPCTADRAWPADARASVSEYAHRLEPE